jgi:anti-anti-sigma factor
LRAGGGYSGADAADDQVGGECVAWSERSAPVRVEVVQDGHQTVVHAAGELDSAAADALRRALPSPGQCAPWVVLDLGGVTFCAVAGARVLAQWRDRVEAGGGRVLLRHPQRAVLRVLEVTGLQAWSTESDAGIGGAGAVHAGGDGQALTALLAGAMRRAMLATGAPMGSAQRFESSDETLRLVGHHGFGSRFVEYFATVGGPETSCGAAARDLRAVFVDDVLVSPVFAGAERDELLRAGVGSVASMPVLSPQRTLLGVVSTHYPRTHAWTPERRSTLLKTGEHTTAA